MTKLQIANAAVSQLGDDSSITDLDDTANNKANAVRVWWPVALAEFLREFHWNWAKTRVTLDPESPVPDFGWDNRFALPDDYVSLVAVNEQYATTPSDLFEIESGYLFGDFDEADIEYIYTPSDSTLTAFLTRMDGLAVTALTTLLASKISTRIAKDGGQMALSLKQQYLSIDLPRARAKNANEQRPAPRMPFATSQVIGARSGFTNP